ncbi:MAG: hypothetical protein MHMPM18_002581, partial [Marteilia pararefringens]
MSFSTIDDILHPFYVSNIHFRKTYRRYSIAILILILAPAYSKDKIIGLSKALSTSF